MTNSCDCNWVQRNIPGVDYQDIHGRGSEAHWNRKGMYVGVVILSFIILGSFLIADSRIENKLVADAVLDRADCHEMEEYIAYKKWDYKEVAHAYKWLCTENKVMELEE